MRIASIIALSLLTCGCETPHEVGAAEAGPGKLTVVDTGGFEGDTGWWPSVVFDHNDTPHLSFCDAAQGNLRYATRKGSAWLVESAIQKGAVGKYTSIDVDSKGTIGISFYDQDNKYLRYAWRDGDGWKTERIAWGLEVGMASELRFDAADQPHVFYYIPSGKLAHAHRTAAAQWRKETIHDATGGFSARISAVLRPEGFWVSFLHWNFTNSLLYLAKPRAEGGWQTELVTDRDGSGWRSQLVFDGDEPLVFFSRNLKNDLRMAYRKEGEWVGETVLEEAANFAAQRRPDGEIVIAYEDITNSSAGNGTIKYLLGRPGKWRRFIVDMEGPAGSYLDLALAKTGKPTIVYYAADIRSLKVYDETVGQ